MLQLPHDKPTTAEGALGKPKRFPQSHLYVALILLPPLHILPIPEDSHYDAMLRCILFRSGKRNTTLEFLQSRAIESPMVADHSTVTTCRMLEYLLFHFNLLFLFRLMLQKLFPNPSGEVIHAFGYDR